MQFRGRLCNDESLSDPAIREAVDHKAVNLDFSTGQSRTPRVARDSNGEVLEQLAVIGTDQQASKLLAAVFSSRCDSGKKLRSRPVCHDARVENPSRV